MIEQLLLVVFSVVPIWLTQQRNEHLKKYACIFGIIVQPVWVYIGYNTNQWGIIIVSIVYVFVWGVGVRNNWISPNPKIIGYQPRVELRSSPPQDE